MVVCTFSFTGEQPEKMQLFIYRDFL